ncbi:MAG: UDP-N-acetylmuramate dehydrogenase [Myxococcota bacterium]
MKGWIATRGDPSCFALPDDKVKTFWGKHKATQWLESIEHHTNFPLARATTFRIGGPADVLARPNTVEELARVMAVARDHGIPVFILGGGSNILVSDQGFAGIAIQLKGELTQIQVRDDGREIVAGAGAPYPALTRAALRLGWPSAVGWMGTPGQVGGALRMNAGSRLGEIGDVVHEVEGILHGEPRAVSRSDITFAYRDSSLSEMDVITHARLRGEPGDESQVRDCQQRAREQVRARFTRQPKGPSAGSVFRNPLGDFAGRLIEACNLKGTRVGGAQVSPVHANFIVNTGGAAAQDVYRLSREIQRIVHENSGVMLQYELRFVGDFDSAGLWCAVA